MALNTKRWAQKKKEVDQKLKERQEGNLWGKIEEGEYLCYVHPLIYPDDEHEHTSGYNFIEVLMHYNLGGQNNAQLCLNYKENPILSHPIVQKFVANREKNAFKITPKLRCEVCEKIESGEITNPKNKQQIKWFFGLTPMWYRKDKGDEWSRIKFKPRFLISGPQIFNDYMDCLIDLSSSDIEPMDPESAVLLKLGRTGTDFNTTEYSVSIDIDSAREPIKLDKGQKAAIAKVVKPKGELDLFHLVSSFTKSPRQISALIAGVSERNVDDEEAETPKECFGKNWEDDDECKACDSSEECMRVCGVKPKKVEAKSSNKGKADSNKKKAQKEPEEEQQGVEEDEPQYESEMECFANYDSEDEACKTCNEAEQCFDATPDGVVPDNEEESEQDGYEQSEEDIATPNCYGQYENDDEDCARCDVRKKCEVDSEVDDSNSQVEQEQESEEEDPDVASLKEEAERLAKKSRGRGKK